MAAGGDDLRNPGKHENKTNRRSGSGWSARREETMIHTEVVKTNESVPFRLAAN
jgi:hypothetical protein